MRIVIGIVFLLGVFDCIGRVRNFYYDDYPIVITRQRDIINFWLNLGVTAVIGYCFWSL